MFTENYKIADKSVKISSIYEQVHHLCQDYRTDEPEDYAVCITEADIQYEQEKSRKTDIAEGRRPYDCTPEYLEELAVYRKIADKMPDYDTFLFHGSVIAVDGQAYLFTAKSGTGKSTHTRLWREMLGEKAVMVNDDKPLIRIGKDAVTVFGTPYNGKHRLGCNISVPLKAVCILERGEENRIRNITKSEAYTMLLQQVYHPADAVQMKKTLLLIDALAARVSLYRMQCNMNPSAAETAYHTMKG
ncbi:MAG: hypothetical protein IJ644_05285 [Oscillospiraceae bacterium]|nr:hypothetical protein [Oscillospiraceae bacterium]